MVDTFSEADNRKQTWERDIKGFAAKRYVMKELVMVTSSSSWDNSFYQKTATSLTGGTSSAVQGIPRGAEFPFLERGTTLKNAIILQHGGEGVIYWQDILTSNIAIEAETMSDISDAVVYSVDNKIYNTMSENDTPSTINTVAITAGYEWDSATIQNRDPVYDILRAIETITTKRYPILTSGLGFIAMNEATYTLLMSNSKVLNHPTFKLANGIIRNGQLAEICGLKIYVTPVVTNDKVLVGMAKKCATWKQVQPLTVDVIIDPQKKYTIRASEIGVCQLTNPEALCLITNTRA
jgi:hypothetical protein